MNPNYNPVTPLRYFEQERPDIPSSTYMRGGQNTQQSQINCMDVWNHVESCPACSKIYDKDKTVYVVTIFILVMFLFFALYPKMS